MICLLKRFCIFILLCQLPLNSLATLWVNIDTEAATLSLMRDKNVVFTFDNISHGRAGVTDLHILNDDKTARGEFTITRINRQSQYRIFFEINYPTTQHAQMALEQGIIDEATYNRIATSQLKYGRAPSDTPLGGLLGIHGIGRGSLDFHTKFNWTNGCIAVTNKQIVQLSKWIGVGTKVIIN